MTVFPRGDPRAMNVMKFVHSLKLLFALITPRDVDGWAKTTIKEKANKNQKA